MYDFLSRWTRPADEARVDGLPADRGHLPVSIYGVIMVITIRTAADAISILISIWHKMHTVYYARKLMGSQSSLANEAKQNKISLLLRWPRRVAQVEFSLSSAGFLSLTHSFSVFSENIAINHNITVK